MARRLLVTERACSHCSWLTAGHVIRLCLEVCMLFQKSTSRWTCHVTWHVIRALACTRYQLNLRPLRSVPATLAACVSRIYRVACQLDGLLTVQVQAQATGAAASLRPWPGSMYTQGRQVHCMPSQKRAAAMGATPGLNTSWKVAPLALQADHQWCS